MMSVVRLIVTCYSDREWISTWSLWFFFSSRRRHTRCLSDWSSDVCSSDLPVVALMLLVKRGAADDPPGKEGLAAITVDMMDEGSGDRSAIEIHEGLARLGAQLRSEERRVGKECRSRGTGENSKQNENDE